MQVEYHARHDNDLRLEEGEAVRRYRGLRYAVSAVMQLHAAAKLRRDDPFCPLC